MFTAEAMLSAQLNHGNIVQVFEFAENEGELYLAMEYVHGVNLAELLKRLDGVPIPTGMAAYLVREVALALAYAHALKDEDGRSLSIIHRDVSPSNVMVGYDGSVKLVDFGVAHGPQPGRRHPTAMRIRSRARWRTCRPRRWRARSTLDGRTDIFAAGVLLHELLTARGCSGPTTIATPWPWCGPARSRPPSRAAVRRAARARPHRGPGAGPRPPLALRHRRRLRRRAHRGGGPLSLGPRAHGRLPAPSRGSSPAARRPPTAHGGRRHRARLATARDQAHHRGRAAARARAARLPPVENRRRLRWALTGAAAALALSGALALGSGCRAPTAATLAATWPRLTTGSTVTSPGRPPAPSHTGAAGTVYDDPGGRTFLGEDKPDDSSVLTGGAV